MNLLKDEAKKIKKYSGIYSQSTKVADFAIDEFIGFFDQIMISNDKDLLLGFCYSIGPFILKNYSRIRKDQIIDFWDGLIKLSILITEEIEIYGFCEAISAICFKCFEIADTFFDFLIDPKAHNSEIKPPILITLYNDLPEDFISNHADVFAPLISNYFLTADPVHKALNLVLVTALDFSGEKLRNIPNFENNLWSSIFDLVSNHHSYYHTLIGPFLKFKKLTPSFFTNSSDFIRLKVQEIVDSSFNEENIQKIIPLLKLIPFLSLDDLDSLFRKIIPILSLFFFHVNSIPKEFTKALNESRKILRSKDSVLKIYSICCEFLETENYPAIIYLLGIFTDKFSIYYKDSFNLIFEKFINGLESSYPIKFPIIFAINENLDFVYSLKDNNVLLKEKIIPMLFEIIIKSINEADIHWSLKALRNVLRIFDSNEFFPKFSEILEIYPIISSKYSPKCSNNFSINCQQKFSHNYVHDFFKLIYESIKCSLTTEDISAVVEFIQNILMEDVSFNVKSEICVLIRVLCREYENESKKLIEIGFSLANELIFSDFTDYFDVAFHLLGFFSENRFYSFDEAKFINQAYRIVNQEIVTSPNIQREVFYNLSRFSSSTFPTEIVSEFLGKDDDEFQMVAIVVIDRYYHRYNKSSLNKCCTHCSHSCHDCHEVQIDETKIKNNNSLGKDELIPFIKKLSVLIKNSKSSEIVNDSFTIFSKMINKFDDLPTKHFDDVLLTTMQGRLAIFNHTMPYNYDSQQFQFFRFISHYIVKYPTNAKWVLEDFMLWILRASSCMISKILKVLEIGLEMKLINSRMANDLCASITARIDEDNSNFNLVKSGTLLMMKIKHKFPNNFKIPEFLVFLEKIWEENSNDRVFIELLTPIFLEIFSEKTFNIHGDFEIFHEISSIIIAESFDFDYPKIVEYYIKMHANKIPFDSFDNDSAAVFVHFLVKNTRILHEDGFTLETLQTMHKCLKQTLKSNKSTIRYINNFFSKNQVAIERIRYLIKSPKLPDF
ncbi:hypothetical protein TRFO_01280 [Tritrichomonas foetus]|uniref:Uncharacterized protein n=1 Tax=Tritrichomonas foetus TaxID=1144522 RepID=A0A1J4KBU8_9EUKA|nr:hypothetical protein TRFO_01280 [Tritrichomonas foetus]|eukprot:OHT07158.1 hypothetical protein TRFO_01280 [Tritrichomonas foetus]